MRCALALVLMSAPAMVQAQCLSYAERVRLEGVLERRTFPGPPNYESIAKGDRPETVWLLRLMRPACVDGGAADPTNARIDRLKAVQLVVTERQYKTDKRRLGQRVSVSGRLFGGWSGHHHTPALLEDIRFER